MNKWKSFLGFHVPHHSIFSMPAQSFDIQASTPSILKIPIGVVPILKIYCKLLQHTYFLAIFFLLK